MNAIKKVVPLISFFILGMMAFSSCAKNYMFQGTSSRKVKEGRLFYKKYYIIDSWVLDPKLKTYFLNNRSAEIHSVCRASAQKNDHEKIVCAINYLNLEDFASARAEYEAVSDSAGCDKLLLDADIKCSENDNGVYSSKANMFSLYQNALDCYNSDEHTLLIKMRGKLARNER